MSIAINRVVLAAMLALGIAATAGSASAAPLQVSAEGLIFSSGTSLGSTDLSDIGFSFTGTIDSSADTIPDDGTGAFILGLTTFTLTTGGSFTTLAGELQFFLSDLGSSISFSLQDANEIGGASTRFLNFPALFDVDAPTPGDLSVRGAGGSGGSGGTIDFGADGLLTYFGGPFSFGDNATATFTALTPVPAPSAAALLAAGLAGMAWARRRRRS